MSSESSGTYAAADGLKTNYGFNASVTKKGKNDAVDGIMVCCCIHPNGMEQVQLSGRWLEGIYPCVR